MTAGPILTAAERAFLDAARTATLATIDSSGRPRLVPICFVLAAHDGVEPVLFTPLDEKPKRTDDPRELARVRDILARPDVAVLVDRWSEDWTELAWLRAVGRARLLEAGAGAGAVERDLAIDALRGKYPQYRRTPAGVPATHPDRGGARRDVGDFQRRDLSGARFCYADGISLQDRHAGDGARMPSVAR